MSVGAKAQRSLPTAQVVVAAFFALIVLVQGVSAPFQKDAEPQSAEWIVSIVHQGNWLIPHDYYGSIDRKPPLYYWLSAMVARATGSSIDETRARIVSVFSATLISIEVLVWTASEVGMAEGWLAYLFLLGIYGFSSRATLALTDMLMTALLMSAYLVIYPMLFGSVSWRRTIAAGVLMGLAVLTKGPVVLIVVGLALIAYSFWRGENPIDLLQRAWPWGIAACALAIGACWYIPWFAFGGHREIRIFLDENLGHFAPSGLGGTGEATRPIWFILARLIGAANPLILLMPATLVGLFTSEVSEEKSPPLLFHASLITSVVLFFSLASAKRDDYVLPALPSVAILCAGAFGMLDRSREGPGAVTIRNGVSGLIAIAALLMAPLAIVTARNRTALPLDSSDVQLMAMVERGIATHSVPFIAFLVAASLAAIATIVALIRRRIWMSGIMVGLISLSGVVLMDAFARPELAELRSYKSFVSEIRPQVDGHRLFAVNNAEFELSFYYGQRVPGLIGRRAEIPPSDSPSFLVARSRDLPDLPDTYRQRIRPVITSNLVGGDGPPVLYLIKPIASDLKKVRGTGR